MDKSIHGEVEGVHKITVFDLKDIEEYETKDSKVEIINVEVVSRDCLWVSLRDSDDNKVLPEHGKIPSWTPNKEMGSLKFEIKNKIEDGRNS